MPEDGRRPWLQGVSLAVDGRIVAEFPGDDASATPVFSPNGGRVAWWLKKGPTCVLYVNGDPQSDGRPVDSEPAYTASGHLVRVVRTGHRESATVVVDGRPGQLAEDLAINRSVRYQFGRDLAPACVPPFAVSPDGEHVAWTGQFEGTWHPVLDDRVGPAFELPLAWSFDATGVATWYAQRGNVVYRVTA